MDELIRHIKHGQGALALHGVVDQTHAKVDVFTPIHLVGRQVVNGVMRKRSGIAAPKGQNVKEYNYIRRPPGEYPSTVGGMEGFGNRAGGAQNMGGHDHVVKLMEDLTEAMNTADHEVHMDPHFVKASHNQYIDRSHTSVMDHLKEESEDYQRMRIANLLHKGFSEEEITKKLEKEREQAIDKAEKMPFSKEALMSATLAKMAPTQLNEDFEHQGGPVGLVPSKRDTSAFQRSTDSGTSVQRRRKYEAMNTQLRMARGVHREEAEPHIVEEVTPAAVIPKVVREVNVQKQSRLENQQVKHREMLRIKDADEHQYAAMRRAMGIEEHPVPPVDVAPMPIVGSPEAPARVNVPQGGRDHAEDGGAQIAAPILMLENEASGGDAIRNLMRGQPGRGRPRAMPQGEKEIRRQESNARYYAKKALEKAYLTGKSNVKPD
jgi:hypothetical protein